MTVFEIEETSITLLAIGCHQSTESKY